MQVVFAIAGTMIAAVLVATFGDSSGNRTLMAARNVQEQQLAGSWAADHKGLTRLAMKNAAKAKLAAKQALQDAAPQASEDVPSAAVNDDVSQSAANKLYGAEAGMGGNTAEPPYEVDEDSDVGLCPLSLACLCTCVCMRGVFSWSCTCSCILATCFV